MSELEQQIDQLALQEICPTTMEATTLYEKAAVKKFKVFGYKVQSIITDREAFTETNYRREYARLEEIQAALTAENEQLKADLLTQLQRGKEMESALDKTEAALLNLSALFDEYKTEVEDTLSIVRKAIIQQALAKEEVGNE